VRTQASAHTGEIGSEFRLESIQMSADNETDRRNALDIRHEPRSRARLHRREPEVRLRELAQRVGLTERAAQSLVNDLVDAGYVTRKRVGRRNRYEIDASLPLRHPYERELEVDTLLRALRGEPA
jgi:DNA-binding transcriptional ArsR family regulator